MKARMLVDAKVVASDPDHPVAVYAIGQELEGAEAEAQVSLGHAEAIADAPAAEAVEVDATPGAVAHAEALGVDLSQVEGSGAGGKVTKADVAAAAKQSDDDGA